MTSSALPLSPSPPVVWISRPAARAASLAADIAACGMRPLLRPAMHIEDIAGARDAAARHAARAADFDVTVFVSREAAARLAAAFDDGAVSAGGGKCPALALGAATAAALPSAYALALPAAATGDSAQLLASADSLFAACRRAAIVGGTDERDAPPAPAVARALRARGIAVENVILYRRRPAPVDAELSALGARGGIQAAIAFSGDSLKYMLAMTAPNNQWLRRVPLFVIHANIAAAAARLGFARITTAAAPVLAQTIRQTIAVAPCPLAPAAGAC